MNKKEKTLSLDYYILMHEYMNFVYEAKALTLQEQGEDRDVILGSTNNQSPTKILDYKQRIYDR